MIGSWGGELSGCCGPLFGVNAQTGEADIGRNAGGEIVLPVVEEARRVFGVAARVWSARRRAAALQLLKEAGRAYLLTAPGSLGIGRGQDYFNNPQTRSFVITLGINR